MEELEGWHDLARLSELGHEVFSDALSLFDGSIFAQMSLKVNCVLDTYITASTGICCFS